MFWHPTDLSSSPALFWRPCGESHLTLSNPGSHWKISTRWVDQRGLAFFKEISCGQLFCFPYTTTLRQVSNFQRSTFNVQQQPELRHGGQGASGFKITISVKKRCRICLRRKTWRQTSSPYNGYTAILSIYVNLDVYMASRYTCCCSWHIRPSWNSFNALAP